MLGTKEERSTLAAITAMTVLSTTLMAVGCDKKSDPPLTLASAQPKAAASASPSATSASSPAAIDAAKLLTERPELLVEATPDWLDRVKAHLRGEKKVSACPQLATVSGNDEFEKKESRDKAEAECNAENDRALAFFKSCPFVIRLPSSVGEYDFNAEGFPITDATKKSAVATSGRVWLQRQLLLAWPGAEPGKNRSTDEFVKSGGLCKVDPAQAEEQMDALTLLLRMGKPEAKAFRQKLHDDATTVVEVVFTLDGNTAKDSFSCGGRPPVPNATGRVLAWRLKISDAPIAWISADTFEPPASCDDAKAMLGPKAAATLQAAGSATPDGGTPAAALPTSSAKTSAPKKAPPSKGKSCEERCADECMKEAPTMLMQCHGQCTMTKCK